jgi:hypothetical protein
MTAIHPDSEVVATTFDPLTGICSYTIQRDGKRWTARIPIEELDKFKANRAGRRTYLANALKQAMIGPPDPEPEAKSDDAL